VPNKSQNQLKPLDCKDIITTAAISTPGYFLIDFINKKVINKDHSIKGKQKTIFLPYFQHFNATIS